MQFQENGLEIAVFPPQGETISLERNCQTKVRITNKHHFQGIKLSVALDLDSKLQQWCKKDKFSISLGYGKTQEVDFDWNVPSQTAAGTYEYYLRIEFLRSTSFYSVQPKLRQLTILPTVIKPQANYVEPSFIISPASDATRSIVLSSEQPTTVEIEVINRSNKTDNFRVTTDLETAWYTIRYPETFKKIGVVDGSTALNLNPGETGKAHLNIKPPSDAIAGNYKPEIELHSLNSPTLFLKKIIYLTIAPRYSLQAEMQTILDKVSYKQGQYKIILNNQGNTLRQLKLTPHSSDETENCEYTLATSTVKLLPDTTQKISLEIQPNSSQRKPWLINQQFNFKIDLVDLNNYPLPKNSTLQGRLLRKPRPLWQLISLCLLALVVLGGGVLAIRWLLFAPQPQSKITLKPEQPAYPYGEKVSLEWAVENPQNISQIYLYDRDLERQNINTKCYNLTDETSANNCLQLDIQNPPEKCQYQSKTISCSGAAFTHAKEVKEYTFILEAIPTAGEAIINETKVKIQEKPGLKIFEPLKVANKVYQPNEPVSLSFEAANIDRLQGEDKLFLTIDNQRQLNPIITPQNIQEVCSSNLGERYSCQVELTQLPEGENTLGIELQSDSEGRTNPQPQKFNLPHPVVVKTPISLNYFQINNSDSGTLEVEPNTPITVSWSVTGNAKVSLDCVGGTLDLQGTKTLNVPAGVTQSCIIQILDETDRIIDNRTLSVKVKPENKPKELPDSESNYQKLFE